MSDKPKNPQVVIRSKESPSLEEAQTFVGGYVEVVRLNDDSQLLLNENGILEGLPPNRHATRMAKESGINMGSRGILGNVMILRGDAKWS